MNGAQRRVLLLTHPGRPEALDVAIGVAERLTEAGIEVRVPAGEIAQSILGRHPVSVVHDGDDPARDVELVVVLGGDGTILRGAETARGTGTPVLGVNLGHVGFLAEAEREDVDATVEHIVDRHYRVEERMALDVVATRDGVEVARSWALNEVTVEKAARERMLLLTIEIDGRPLSTWGCDGVVMSTPTGSTAYAFSSGGPIVWPGVEAMLVVPLSAHALFARPLVVAPTSDLAVELVQGTEGHGVMWCDGRRAVNLPPGSRVEVSHSSEPVRLARLNEAPFTDRLVAKFDLPVQGWRGGARPGTQD